MRKNYFLLLSFCALSTGLFAQNRLEVVENYLKYEAQKNAQISSNFDYVILDESESLNKAEYVKIQQKINGIPVFDRFGTFSIKNGKVLNFNQNFIDPSALNTTSVIPELSVEDALNKYSSAQGKRLILVSKPSDILPLAENVVHFSNLTPHQLVYFFDGKQAKLSWHLLAEIKGKKNDEGVYDINGLNEIILDAQTGQLLQNKNVIDACNFHSEDAKKSLNVYNNNPSDFNWIREEYSNLDNLSFDGKYRVIPANSQSPLTHTFDLLTNQPDTNASIEGWHKLIPNTSRNTALTANHTIGNNSHIGYDKDGAFSDLLASSEFYLLFAQLYMNNEVNGGPDLNFDFPTPGNSTNYNPLDYTDAAATQMFYSTNFIHDVLHYHGFNPANGSFQANVGEGFNLNGFTTSGLGQTTVRNNAAMGYSSSLVKNPTAIFYTFQTSNGPIFKIPSGDLAGEYYGGYGNNTAYNYSSGNPINGEFVLVKDADTTNDILDGCDTITNGSDLTGKIAVVNRGTCNFSVKVNNIKTYNPSAIVILNVQDANITNQISISDAANGIDNNSLNYPIVFLNKDIGDPLRVKLQNNETFTGSLPLSTFRLSNVDSSFDSQIILHEYVHAVSKRLANDAITGEEGMGEGWSDYIALNLTQDISHTATDQINMGAYAFGGAGLRILPYTTDLTINPHTYDFLKVIGSGSQPHATGYLWALTLWEMHWNLVDKYGFNPDIKSETGGNNIALNLVLEGLKLQVANPGFVDGRDAILQADQALYNGANQCEIWTGFAKRGLGYSAVQGLSSSRTDGNEAFDLPQACQNLDTNELTSSLISIYPNPIKDKIYIQSKENVNKAELIDLTGRLIAVQEFKNDMHKVVDTSILSKGVYLLKLHTSKEIITKKVIKN